MQEFEKYPKLTTHIEKLASYGSYLSGSEWNAFLVALNEALKISSNPLLSDSLVAYQKWCYEHPEYDQVTETPKVEIYLKATNVR